ncbi:MAG: hypothetical protein WCJ07_09030, partial [Verrucomicrobiota bacterium]
MSLDLSKLEKVRDLASGIVQARCPACAEGGNDRSGEHLRVYPDGKFGCCVHPKDSFHRKRIWVLAGRKLHLSPVNSVSLRFKPPPAIPAAQSVKAALLARTPRTPKTELETSVLAVPLYPVVDSRTPRTGISEFRARARVDSTIDHIWMVDLPEKLKDLESAVRAARTSCGGPSDGHQS